FPSQVTLADGKRRRRAATVGRACTMSPNELGLITNKRLPLLKDKGILLFQNPPSRLRQIASHIVRREAPLGHPRLLLLGRIPASDEDRECADIACQLHVSGFIADHDRIAGEYA